MPLKGSCLATSDAPRVSPLGVSPGKGVGQKWVVKVGWKKKTQHTTCQFIQHFREQLLAG